MKVYRSLDEIRLHDTAVAIGVFDGFHRGHRKVLQRARESSRQVGGAMSVALTFDRHPAELVAPSFAPKYLSSLSQRIELLAESSSVDAVVVVPFDNEFANLTAQQFVKEVLVDRLDAIRIFVGADFRYGRGRSGSVMDLQAAGEAYHFGVDLVHSVADQGERVSSTRIRALIADGDISSSTRLLGHSFVIRGKVVSGKKLGRTIGFPTANVAPEQHNQILPKSGVYAARLMVHDDHSNNRVWPAAVSIGVNPTTDGPNTDPKIEAYIMDGFDSDIYGSIVDVELVNFIRNEEKFETLNALIAQINADIHVIASFLRAEENLSQIV